MVNVEVTRIERVSSDSWKLFWKRDFDFKPGQVVNISVLGSEAKRIYSLVTGNKESEAGILFNLVEDGWLTPQIARLRPGEILSVSEPFGSFLSQGNLHTEVWISNGTGVAPFISMVRSGITSNKTLIHGARTLELFYDQTLLSERLGSNYIRCCSQESSADVFSGRLTTYIEDNTWPAQAHYLLCGSAGMVVDVRDLLIAHGISFNSIFSEVYF